MLAGELEEDVLEVGALGAHLVDDDPGGRRGLADDLGGGGGREQLVGPIEAGLDALGGQRAEGLGLGVRTRTSWSVRAVRAARVDWVTSRPLAMITTWSTVWATSARTWLETSTVRPWSAS